MAEHSEQSRPALLDRTIDLTVVNWTAIAWAVIVVFAVAVRFLQLDVWALSPDEAHRAFNAWSLFRGAASDPGRSIPNTAPLLTVLQAFAFFLFGATDSVARVMSALLGLGLVLLIAGLRPYVSRAGTIGMAALAALSPTLVYASRVVDPAIGVAFGAMLLLVSLLRLGDVERTAGSRLAWSLLCGVAVGIMLASGPLAITTLISLAVGGLAASMFDRTGDGAIRRSMRGFSSTPSAMLMALNGFVVTIILLFSRFLSDLNALRGIGETFADWARLMTTAGSNTPTQFFVLALLVYEILALVFAVVVISRESTSEPEQLSWTFFAGWFAASLLLVSFSSGRAPDQAAIVALPLILLAGIGLGETIAAIDLNETLYGRGGALLLSLIGFVIASVAFVVLIKRIDNAANQTQAILEAAIVGVLVVIPLLFACVSLFRAELATGKQAQPIVMILLVLALFFGAYTLRSTVLSSFFDADEGTEMLAAETSTAAVKPLVDRLMRLSRDVTVTNTSVRDPTGGHGLSVAIDRRVESPYRWYFREFPDAGLVAEGQATQSSAQIVIAPDDAGMQEAGYTPRDYNTVNRVPGSYSGWVTDLDYILYREPNTPPAPAKIAVGLNQELTAKVYPNTGPFNLFERPGSGTGRGQFDQPRGIAVSPTDGSVYVVDSGNNRVESFNATGEFVGIWGGETGGNVSFAQTDAGGPTGIATGPNGLIYVCDTWNHRIVVLDSSGRKVNAFGEFGNTNDSPNASDQPGKFFGPRGVAIYNDEIYVVDTGNERVQVFGLDGAFKRAFGGNGTSPSQFIEPVGIAIDEKGLVYVADTNNGRISVFSVDGSPQAQWPVDAWKNQQFFQPYLAIGSDGNIYATSSATGTVEVFSPAGQHLSSIGQIGSEKLTQPFGVAAATDGSVLITDGGKSAVFRYVPELPPAGEGAPGQGTPAANPPSSPVGSPEASPTPGNG
ncbi:MAG: 6-bladed beta-propeller [Thermomicrobiales bacterium]